MRTNYLKKFILTFFTLAYTFLYASVDLNMNIQEVLEQRLNKNGLLYKITANSKTLNYQNLKKNLFFSNKERIVSKNLYYTNGLFETKDINIYFQKAYFFQGDFIMLNAKGLYKSSNFNAEKIIYKQNRLNFKNVFISLDGKKYRKLKYSLILE